MLEIEGFILVGGASSRMGTNKALLELGGRSFVERIFGAISSITTKTSLIGAQERLVGWPASLPIVPDVHVKWGALGGLHTALAACVAKWAVVVACDLPFVTGELFVRLASLRQNFDAVIPVQPDGRVQPLCALYRTETVRDIAEDLIATGERRPRALLESIRTRRVAFNELSDLEGSTNFFININTPEDHADAKRRIK
ncbi:MAG: molybdenum cofactor guanylyltransferase [Acidobacteriota bacterium]|nr:molybdenum cofactor guanylyltransferase [Acidobacteriota bacterium]